MWPWFRSRFDRRLNRALLMHQLTAALRPLPAPPVAITTIPIVADLIGRLPALRWVYYCVDDFSAWPGLDHAPLRRMEEELVKRADVLVAVSETLRQKLAGMGREPHLLTHGVDLDFWRSPNPAACVPQLSGLERPLVVFWGVIDPRMDLRALERLAAGLERGTVVLAGPEEGLGPAALSLHRVVRLGPLPFDHLPVLAREASVLIMPYADLPVTRAIQPLKLKEYLATGKPVVVRDLPATRDWADCADVVGSPEAFAEAVRLRLRTGLLAPQEKARARLAGESWAEKARQLERWVLAPGPVTSP
jgi:glycosyltransferase involved in cell wall biosynthesis